MKRALLIGGLLLVLLVLGWLVLLVPALLKMK